MSRGRFASLALSAIILPAHMHETETRIVQFLHRIYTPVLKWAVDNRKTVLGGAAGLAVYLTIITPLWLHPLRDRRARSRGLVADEIARDLA